MTVSGAESCSKVERVQDSAKSEIVLSAFGLSKTKGEVMPTENKFSVYAFYSDCSGQTKWDTPQAWDAIDPSAPYLDNAAFAYDGAYWAGYPDPYYWPLDGSLMFAGYCPHEDFANGAITDVELVANQVDRNPYMHIKFTQNTTPAQMVDLLWFDVKDVADGNSVSKTDRSIPIEFKHALSQVSFEFVDAAEIFYLKSLKIKDCINTSEFYSGVTPGWLPDIDAVADYVILDVADGAVNPQLNGWTTPEGEMLHIIPQYLNGVFPSVNGTLDNGLDVVLEIALTDGFGSEVMTLPLKDYTERWEIGYHYHYTITVTADPIDFTAPDFEITTRVVTM